jgi:hypothetical protein
VTSSIISRVLVPATIVEATVINRADFASDDRIAFVSHHVLIHIVDTYRTAAAIEEVIIHRILVYMTVVVVKKSLSALNSTNSLSDVVTWWIQEQVVI